MIKTLRQVFDESMRQSAVDSRRLNGNVDAALAAVVDYAIGLREPPGSRVIEGKAYKVYARVDGAS